MHLVGNIRRIDGKRFKAISGHQLKSSAQHKAIKVRKSGRDARVLPAKTSKYGKEWYVWREIK